MRAGSAAAASCLKRPIASRRTAAFTPHGSVSYTYPRDTSSQDSQVFHGVLPPAQFCRVPDRMRYAPVIAPADENFTALAPPEGLISELET